MVLLILVSMLLVGRVSPVVIFLFSIGKIVQYKFYDDDDDDNN